MRRVRGKNRGIIGGHLKAAREQAGLSQEDLANKAGVHRLTVVKLESGKRPTDPQQRGGNIMASDLWAVSSALRGTAFVVLGDLILIADQGSQASNALWAAEVRLLVSEVRPSSPRHSFDSATTA